MTEVLCSNVSNCSSQSQPLQVKIYLFTTKRLNFHLFFFTFKSAACERAVRCHSQDGGRSALRRSVYLFWWCYKARRAGACCLLQCPDAAPCSCSVRTPLPAYLCPGTAGHKTQHTSCDSTAFKAAALSFKGKKFQLSAEGARCQRLRAAARLKRGLKLPSTDAS